MVYLLAKLSKLSVKRGERPQDVGGKGAGLAEMTRVGLPVPPGFTITTKACMAYIQDGNKFPEGLWEQVLAALAEVERQTGKKFGDPKNPLLVSVRSGAKFSMPGMMDTILNVGLNDKVVPTVALTKNERFVWDGYRRLLSMFGHTAMGISVRLLGDGALRNSASKTTDLTADDLKELATFQTGLLRLGRKFRTLRSYGSRAGGRNSLDRQARGIIAMSTSQTPGTAVSIPLTSATRAGTAHGCGFARPRGGAHFRRYYRSTHRARTWWRNPQH